jgi:DNA-binding PadR family transcriptional regulator
MDTPITTKTDLLLLGLLLDRPMHGYELHQHIQAEGIDEWFHVSAAGVYYSLRKLRDQGLVAESRQQKRGSGRKSIYRLTDKGRSSFFEAMEAELASREEVFFEYDVVIYLLNRLPLQRAIPQLEQRQAFLAGRLQTLREVLAVERDGESVSLQLAILDHKRRFLEMEEEWLGDVICSIQAEDESCDVSEGERQGLMILNGDLRDFHLPDLFHLIVSGRHSGTLRVSDGADVRTLVFKEGQPFCASYVRRGDPPEPATTCEEVMAGLCDLFRWQEGRFTFDQRVEYQDWSVPLECTTEDLILRGCRKVDSWALIQRLVPSGDTIFEKGAAAQRLDRLALRAVEEQVATAVDGVKDVNSIARELDLTLFETSRVLYCLTAIGLLRTADLDKIRLRRVFREIAELICSSTLAWRSTPDDRTCEDEVNRRTTQLPIHLDHGHIEDQTDLQMDTDELRAMYRLFLQEQFGVVSRRFGQANARQSFERTLQRLAPELQDVARRHGLDRITRN